jgi:RHS repeat-associated protein
VGHPAATNRFQTIPGGTPAYDLNGNLTNDVSHTYTWDAEGKVLSIDTVNLTYDAMGRMVEQNRSGTYTQIVYSPTGSKLALMSGQALQKAFVPLPGKAAAVYTGSGLAYYRHPDRLGSSRLASTPGRTKYYDVAYAPYGESYAGSGTTDLSFTGQNQDTVSGMYDFLYREYHSVQGRWISPDPAGLGAVSLADPRTWNRYAYVMNSPLAFTDPLGLACSVDPCPPGREPGAPDGPPPTSPGPTGINDALGGPLGGLDVGPFPLIFLGGRRGGGPSLDQRIQRAIDLASALLSDPSCASLFSSDIDPVSLLSDLASGGESGSISAGLLGSPNMVAATTPQLSSVIVSTPNGPLRQSTFLPRANITINSDPRAPFSAGFGGFLGENDEMAMALAIVHEVGHGANFVYGQGSSVLIYDQGTTPFSSGQMSFVNSLMVLYRCGPK